MTTRLRLAALVPLLALALALATPDAAAHPELLRANPAADALLAAPPSRLELWFSERIDAGAGSPSVAALDELGNRIDLVAAIDPADPRHLIVDADGQHQPHDTVRLVSQLDRYELVVGARSANSQASWSRRIGNHWLNRTASYLTGHPIPDLTSGFRAAHRECMLEFIHLFPNGFSTPTTSTMSFIRAGYSVRFEPIVAAQRLGTSKIRLGSDGARFVLVLLKVMTIFSPLRLFVPVSGALFALGAAYATWTIATQSHVTNSSVLLILSSIVILLIGLVSEQIASLRSEGRRS